MFLRHESCPKCGSSDANAIYSDGSSWCFSCHTYVPGEFTGEAVAKKQHSLWFPSDLTTQLSDSCVKLIDTYELGKFSFYYSPSEDRLIYIWYDQGQPVGWEGRALSPNKRKWYKVGDTKEHLLHCPTTVFTGTVVLVEDLFSALKLSDVVDVFLVGGTNVPTSTLASLGRLYSTVVVWFDGDPPGIQASNKALSRLRMLATNSAQISTPVDPKLYSTIQMSNILQDTITT